MTREGKDSSSVGNTLVGPEDALNNKEVRIGSLENAKEYLRDLDVVGNIRSAKLDLTLASLYLKCAMDLTDDAESFNELLTNSKKHFYIALTIFGDSPLPHYGLFKIAVLEGEYKEAFLQLQAYEKQAGGNFNFNLIYQMLMKLLGQERYDEVSNSEYIQDVKVDYEPLSSNYHLAEEAFGKMDYQRTLKHLSICDNLASKKEIDIDFSSAINLANTIFSLHRENQKNSLKTAFADSIDVGERMVIVHKLLSLDATDFESNLLYMDAYIDLKAYNPLIECIERLKSMSTTAEEDNMIGLYERLISEVVIECGNYRSIQATLGRGNRLQREALYRESITWYESAYQKLNFPYFKLQEAESYFEMGELDKAIECCNEYLNSGYLHYVEAAILLYRIYRAKDEPEQALTVALDCYKKARMKERGISLNDWIIRLNNRCHLASEDVNETSKKYALQSMNTN